MIIKLDLAKIGISYIVQQFNLIKKIFWVGIKYLTVSNYNSSRTIKYSRGDLLRNEAEILDTKGQISINYHNFDV